MRISQHNQALPAVERGETLLIEVDGQPVEAYAGETVAAVLLAVGRRSFRHTDKGHVPRGLFCGMGICFDCLVTVDGVPNVRACMTPVQTGMVVETGEVANDGCD
jgi:predicted molibdopterin-dependent oxidoreductase YjgC